MFRVLQLGSNLILTRLLFPEAFGLMALVTVFVGGLSMISDVGLRPAMIRSSRSEDPVFQSTAWTLQIARGFVLTALAWALAWPYAALYETDLLAPLVATTAITTALAGVASIHVYLQERRLDLARVVVMHLGAKLFSVILTVALAWWSGSVWALAWGAIAGAALNTGLSHLFFPSENHRLAWDPATLSEILVFGRWVMLGTLLTYLGGQGLRAIEGLLVDLETLGHLAIAGQIVLALTGLAAALLRGVGFPALAETHRKAPSALPSLAKRIHRLQLALALPVFALLALSAEPLIGALYDDRYAPAGPLLALLALNGALGLLPTAFSSALLALGDSRTQSGLMGIDAGLRIGGTLTGFAIGGVTGMIVGLGLGTTLGALVVFRAVRRHHLGDPWPSLAALVIIWALYGLVLASAL